jgi:serine protease Do
MRRIWKPFFSLVLAGTVGAAIFAAINASSSNNGAHASVPPRINVQSAPLSREAKITTSFAPVIKKVAPSVVNIYSTKTVRVNPRLMPFFDDPFLRRFFGGEFEDDPQDNRRRSRTREEQSLGSGVIVSDDGYILTNNHVVEGADEIKVVLADGKKEFEAKVIGTDPHTEVAVLKVDGQNLPAATTADSDQLEVGDVVLAIGNPFGIGQTVTMGIVSATGRGGFGVVDYEDFIQTDASINPGNSGGALVDAEGRLVGLNTFILSRSGGNQGVGFAVPINLARSVMERLTRDGKVVRGFLGVMLQPLVTAELAKQFGLPDQNGALISEVMPDTPAAKAGLKEGDFIVEFNGKKVEDNRHLRLMASQTAPKTKLTLKVIRDGKEKTFTVTLDELSDKQNAQGMRRSGQSDVGQDTLDGVEVADLDAQLRREFDIPANVRGAVVTNVNQDAPAYRAGLRAGDVILEIGRKPVRNADEAVKMSKDLQSSVLLRVWSKTGTHYLPVDNTKHRK